MLETDQNKRPILSSARLFVYTFLSVCLLLRSSFHSSLWKENNICSLRNGVFFIKHLPWSQTFKQRRWQRCRITLAWVTKWSDGVPWSAAWNSPSCVQDAAGDPRAIFACSSSLRPPESAAILLLSWMLYRRKSETSAQPKVARALGQTKIFLDLFIAFFLAGTIGKTLGAHGKTGGYLGAAPGRRAGKRDSARRYWLGAQK